jgi:hypothetical protein
MLLGVKVPCLDEAAGRTVASVLRVGVAGCFIGHGAFGIITKAAWVPYFAVGGVGEQLAWRLMPWVGTMDISVGLLVLLWPCRALLGWAVVWAAWTALLRPLAGEPVWEFLERAGNYGVPLALLVVSGWRGAWLTRLPGSWPALTGNPGLRLARVLQLTTVILLVGHAGLGFFVHKTGLALHYAALGLGDPAAVSFVGGFEFLLAALVLVWPRPAVLIFVCGWKVATESLFLVAGAPVWELIERFGSYAAPLALALLLANPRPAHAFPSTHLPAT